MATIAELEAQNGRPDRLHGFIVDFEALLSVAKDEAEVLQKGAELLKQLVDQDDWLHAAYAEPAVIGYRQYLLHKDSRNRFSVVSFVWGPGQSTPIHDHTVWGLIGMLRGAEIEQHYALASDGSMQPTGSPHMLWRGQVDAVSPSLGDLHRVSNAYDDRTSISIHAYGANIGEIERSAYELDGRRRSFVSGYSNENAAKLPGRSA